MAKSKYSYTNFQNAVKGLSKKNATAPQLIIAWGPSDFLLMKITSMVKSAANKQGGSIPVIFHEGSNLAQEGLSGLFEQAGLFAQKSLHIVKRTEKIKDLPKKIEKLGTLTPGNDILFCIQTDKHPAKLFKVLNSFSPYEVPCFAPKTKEMQNFLFNLCTAARLNVEQKAINLLLQSIGEDLFSLENAVRKISLEYAEQHEPITYDQIATSIGVMREDNTFKLQNHIIDGKKGLALLLVEDLLERGIEPLSILGILSRHLRQAIQLSGPNKDKVFLPSFVKNQYAGYIKRVGLEKLKLGLIKCHDMDRTFKSSTKISPNLLLSDLVSSI